MIDSEPQYTISDLAPGSDQVVVSVIIPVYNGEMFVGAAMESILRQDFTRFELLVFNDGSSDNTRQIIESFHDDRIKIFNFSKNHGYVKHLNSGIALALGKYIARMDADDISLPDRLEKQVRFMEKYPDVAVCGTSYQMFGAQNDVVKVVTEHEDLKISLLYDSSFGHPTVMMRTDTIRRFSLQYDHYYMPAEDYKLWVDLSKISRIANLAEVLLKYRTHENQISNYKKELQLSKVQEIRKIQIQSLMGRALTQEESDIVFFLFGYPEPNFAPDFAYRAFDFAASLIKINNTTRKYDPAKFEMSLTTRVKNLMSVTAYHPRLLFSSARKMLLAKVALKGKILFLLKCLHLIPST